MKAAKTITMVVSKRRRRRRRRKITLKRPREAVATRAPRKSPATKGGSPGMTSGCLAQSLSSKPHPKG